MREYITLDIVNDGIVRELKGISRVLEELPYL
jgi:hypothetical protein